MADAWGVFGPLPEDERVALLQARRTRTLQVDEFLFREDDPADSVYLVRGGEIKLVKHSEDGRDVVLAVLGAGELAGTLGTLRGDRHRMSAQAMADSTVLGVPRAPFLALIRKYPALALGTAESLAASLEDAYALIQSLAFERAERRIARALLRLAAVAGHRDGAAVTIRMPLTRQDIADMSGTTVETAIRVMSRLQKRGIIASARGQVTLLQAHALVVIAEEVEPRRNSGATETN